VLHHFADIKGKYAH